MNDYEKFLQECELTEESVREQMKQVPVILDLFSDNIYLDKSPLEGIGVFTKKAFNKGDYLGEAVVNVKGSFLKTEIGRFVNHSCKPNCTIDWENNSFAVYANKDLKEKEELTMDYIVNYKEARK